MRNATDGDTGSTLFWSAVPLLGVSCRRCTHRVLLSVQQLQAHANDRRRLRRLPLLCRCGSKAVHTVLLETPDDAPAFLAGDEPAPEGQGSGLLSPTF